MTDDEFTHTIEYFTDDSDYTSHLVRELDDMEATTACGRTLKRAENRRFTRAPMGWTDSIETNGLPAERVRCGNCPWDDVEGSDD